MKAVLTLVSIFINAIPNTVLCVCARLLGGLFFDVIRFRREVVLENLRLAYGNSLSSDGLVKLSRENYTHYALTLFEILKSISWSREDFLKKVSRENFDVFRKALLEGRGAFLVTGHFGNWEVAILATAAAGVPLDVVVKRTNSPYIDGLLHWYRTKTGARLFYESGNLNEIQRSLNGGRVVGFVLDQFMGPPIGVPVTFFGHEAGTAAGLALLLERRETPVILARCFRDASGQLSLKVREPLQFSKRGESLGDRLFDRTQQVNDELERFVREAPTQWLWLHRRWKEFRGESRWRRSSVGVATTILLLLWGLSGCASKEPSPTGIQLPADPAIEVPTLSNISYETEAVAAKPTPTPTPTPLPAPQVEKAKSKKKDVKTVKSEPAPTPVAPVPNTPKVFTVVPADKIPFEIGERLEVDLRWTALPAGRAIMEVREGPVVNGRPTFHLWGNVLSSKIVDAVYHVDNTAESFVDKAGFMPYKYLLHMFESKQLKETRVAFDHAKGKAFFWSKRISERWGNEEIDRVDTLVPQARDIWSALYYSRVLNYTLGQEQKFSVYENAQNWNITLTPVAQELVQTGVGAFHCWKIRVNVELNNVLRPMGDTFMWLSDDSKKYLVKFDTKIKIGSMNGILTSVKEH